MRRVLQALGVFAGLSLTVAMLVLSFWPGLSDQGMVGVIAAEGAVAVRTHDQLGVQDGLVIDEIRVPKPSWIAVYTEGMGGMPGSRVGLREIPAGVSRRVTIPLDGGIRLTENALVVIHVDAGLPHRFEYDEDRFDTSPDKPYWVGGRMVESKVWVRFFEMGNAFRS